MPSMSLIPLPTGGITFLTLSRNRHEIPPHFQEGHSQIYDVLPPSTLGILQSRCKIQDTKTLEEGIFIHVRCPPNTLGNLFECFLRASSIQVSCKLHVFERTKKYDIMYCRPRCVLTVATVLLSCFKSCLSYGSCQRLKLKDSFAGCLSHLSCTQPSRSWFFGCCHVWTLDHCWIVVRNMASNN